MKRPLKYIAVGIGFCPFWWQWGFEPYYDHMLCIGPFRLSWRGWG